MIQINTGSEIPVSNSEITVSNSEISVSNSNTIPNTHIIHFASSYKWNDHKLLLINKSLYIYIYIIYMLGTQSTHGAFKISTV